ncbi:MAG: ATP-dependent Clp protease ATP-binding subunit [Patescibacteria group bacterium]|jgi:ATP-dependent Clp protease ATP-binding subunit ClpC
MFSLFQKFSTNSKQALKNAFSFALASGHQTITPQHILYGLSLQKGSIAAQILTRAKIESEEIKTIINKENSNQRAITQISLTEATKKLLEKAFLIASFNQHKYIGTEHLLASILTIKDGMTTKIFQQKGANVLEIYQQVEMILNSTSKFPDLTDAAEHFNNKSNFLPGENNQGWEDYSSSLSEKPLTADSASILDIFGTNLTDPVIQKKIDPLIGREAEVERVIQILSRRNKNNPLLLGDPGVGKTAIVEGLAKKILLGEVPEILANKKIYTLDLSLVVAGTSFRGEFENRLKQIIQAVKRNPDIILFIDEIHNIIGVGSAAGSMDAANILKPALARGEIRCIGATTLEGYKKQIESDPALERRFQPVMVNQPSMEQTIEILEGIKNNYELFHQVKIDQKAIIAAAELSERYIPDRFLPDKAIDLIDEAASATKVKMGTDQKTKGLKDLRQQLNEISQKKMDAVAQEKFSLALKYRQQEQDLLIQLESLKAKKQKPKVLAEITHQDIAQIVAKITGIPLTDLILAEKNRLLKLEKLLAKKIIAQDEALKSVAEFIRRARTGIADANRPIGSFIFLGPSGVGKTEAAKVLAETIFGNKQALIKIDMSEFAESFNISKLIGAPAGYVGYKEDTKLTDAVKRRPYSLVLFDEIEKAHRQVFNLLLQILEDGYLTDGTGKKVSFKNTIIIMTSNLGSESFNRQAALGFQGQTENKTEEIKQEVLKQLQDKFPPEFLSRIDQTIIFNPLATQAISKIIQLQLKELEKRLAKQRLKIEIEPQVIKTLAKISYQPQIGARAIRKNIQELIENKIARKILTTKSKTIKVGVKDNKIIIN